MEWGGVGEMKGGVGWGGGGEGKLACKFSLPHRHP